MIVVVVTTRLWTIQFADGDDDQCLAPFGLLLLSDAEEMSRPDRLGWWWRRCRKMAGISGAWRPLGMRHWSATMALSQGYDLATVANRLGHSDGSTTLPVYAHAIGKRDAALADSPADALRVSSRASVGAL